MKLSNVQANVIDELLNNEGAYLVESRFYHWSKVMHKGDFLILSIHRPTVEFLKRNKFIILMEGELKKYKINPAFSLINEKCDVGAKTNTGVKAE